MGGAVRGILWSGIKDKQTTTMFAIVNQQFIVIILNQCSFIYFLLFLLLKVLGFRAICYKHSCLLPMSSSVLRPFPLFLPVSLMLLSRIILDLLLFHLNTFLGCLALLNHTTWPNHWSCLTSICSSNSFRPSTSHTLGFSSSSSSFC